MTTVTEILGRSVVVFSQNYLPIGRIDMKRAVVLLVTGKAEPLELEEIGGVFSPVRSASQVLLVPEHIRLKITGTERIWKVPPVNRREVLRRDRHKCQYCGTTKNLTLDHVMPKSRGGTHTWDNVVAACSSCNCRKGDRTPLEAGMLLHSHPRAPIHPAVAFAEKFWRMKLGGMGSQARISC
ncbi:MAG: HNH endonuclease [Oscillatoriaceae cyanobacterium]|uniref:HNH endonuclease n=1 Tax=[Phormidium] sp. ETS-05 TaxID=222819 RepID=UPI0018EF0F27|nr:HNH endonuclease [[Phormidium] sp. ETS-05]